MIKRRKDGITEADGIEGAICILAGIYLTVVKAEHDHGAEHIQETLSRYRKENPEKYELWRRQDEDALYTAIVELSKPLSEDVRREIASCCNSAKIRDAILAL